MRPHRYLDRDLEILEIAKGQRVLHLGCVGHNEYQAEERVRLAKQTLHWKLTAIADVVGIDSSQDVINEYRRLNIFHNILLGDVQRLHNLTLNGSFDLIVAGDIIEHLSNPGKMLDGIKRFCGDKTRIIITTPHAFGLPNFLRYVIGTFREAEEHVMTYNALNIQNLLNRHGYKIDTLQTCFQSKSKLHTNNVLFRVGQTVFKTLPFFGGTLFVIAHLRQVAAPVY